MHQLRGKKLRWCEEECIPASSPSLLSQIQTENYIRWGHTFSHTHVHVEWEHILMKTYLYTSLASFISLHFSCPFQFSIKLVLRISLCPSLSIMGYQVCSLVWRNVGQPSKLVQYLLFWFFYSTHNICIYTQESKAWSRVNVCSYLDPFVPLQGY